MSIFFNYQAFKEALKYNSQAEELPLLDGEKQQESVCMYHSVPTFTEIDQVLPENCYSFFVLIRSQVQSHHSPLIYNKYWKMTHVTLYIDKKLMMFFIFNYYVSTPLPPLLHSGNGRLMLIVLSVCMDLAFGRNVIQLEEMCHTQEPGSDVIFFLFVSAP